jgi:fibronectin type 3 domain-containing protein
VTGSGVGSGVQHSVDVSWNASTSTVAGYNVYRGFQPGGPYQLVNPSGQALAFTDSTVQSGTTYYYVVTSLDSSGVESNFSNEAVAVVPNP